MADIEALVTRCLEKQITPVLRASQVAQASTSPFIVWANSFADNSHKDAPDAFHQMLFEQGDFHEEHVLGVVFPDADTLSYDDARAGFRQVIESCVRGVDSLAQPPLFFLPQGLRGRPDIITRVSGESVFGDYMYVVKEIKYAKNIKQHHCLQTAFYTYVLGEIQGTTPTHFSIINQESEEFVFAYAEYEQLLFDTLAQARTILTRENPPLPVYGENYPWSEYSKQLASEYEDVSLLYRLGRSMRARLNENGIFTLSDLREADKKSVLAIKGVGKSTYDRWSKQLSAYKQQQPVIIRTATLPTASREFYFDIEGDTQLSLDYLYGLLEGDEFTYFWADSPTDERSLWRDFLSFVDGLEDAVIYYYSSYEMQSLRRMKERYGCPEELWDKLISMMIDLFPIVTRSVAFPLAQYSIKPVAKYLGFSWRVVDAGGANSLQWYSEYLEGDKAMKDKILSYNEDDVRATKVLKDWLAQNT